MILKSLKEYFSENEKKRNLIEKDIKAEVNPTPTPAGSERNVTYMYYTWLNIDA